MFQKINPWAKKMVISGSKIKVVVPAYQSQDQQKTIKRIDPHGQPVHNPQIRARYLCQQPKVQTNHLIPKSKFDPLERKTLMPAKMLVISQLNTLEQMRDFLQVLEIIYRKSCGHLNQFRQMLRQRGICHLFNTLMGIPVEPRYFTRDYWDTLAFHLLMAWCQIWGLNYQVKHLVQVINDAKQTQLIPASQVKAQQENSEVKPLKSNFQAYIPPESNSNSNSTTNQTPIDDRPPKSQPIPIPQTNSRPGAKLGKSVSV